MKERLARFFMVWNVERERERERERTDDGIDILKN